MRIYVLKAAGTFGVVTSQRGPPSMSSPGHGNGVPTGRSLGRGGRAVRRVVQ